MDGLTPSALQDELIEVIKEEVKDLYFENKEGNKVLMQVYAQDIPLKATDTDNVPVPYAVVRILSGRTSFDGRANNPESVRVLILIGVKNLSKSGSANKDLLTCMQRIKQRLIERPHTKHFALASDIDWGIDDESPYHYAFGGMDTTWKARQIQREDRFT
jgi:hypothetical protein|nr:MAG TPA: tail completion protein [Caudoviricetes sp.]